MAEPKGVCEMVRRMIAVGAGALVLLALAFLPSTAGAQQYGPTTSTSVAGTSTTNTTSTTSTTSTSTTRVIPSTVPPARPTTSTTVQGDSVVPSTTAKGPAVSGDVVSRPLPRTGSELNGTAMFGGALTVLGIGLALAARKRRNAYEGS